MTIAMTMTNTPAPEPAATATADARADSEAGLASPTARLGTAALTIATVLAGLFAGFFLTYSMSVQLGLARVDDLTYVQTFQAINATIRNAVFAVVFFGCVPAVALAAATSRRRDVRTAAMLTAAAACLVGVVVITFVANVPLNDQLAASVDPSPAEATVARAEFESTWNRWNHARSALSVVGFGLVVVAGVLRRR